MIKLILIELLFVLHLVGEHAQPSRQHAAVFGCSCFTLIPLFLLVHTIACLIVRLFHALPVNDLLFRSLNEVSPQKFWVFGPPPHEVG